MQKLSVKNLFVLLAAVSLLSSCKNGLFGKKNKHEKSSVTGWNYNDKNMGGYNVSKEKEQKTGPRSRFRSGWYLYNGCN
jgi:hypothetical protein